ncbi:MAG: hypothetical protein A2W35_07545 [Chloroflexi bacterium RBG_16_57_11]|nr:MAG: hypothetical protein A2W35_07545 [Chloroflexi bacterium RBG_16_57_11]
MAGLAVRLAGVVEDGAAPGVGVMALRTLPGEMVGRSPVGVAVLAVGSPCGSVVEDGAAPGVGVMA